MPSYISENLFQREGIKFSLVQSLAVVAVMPAKASTYQTKSKSYNKGWRAKENVFLNYLRGTYKDFFCQNFYQIIV